jgi:hypothetical protein
MDWIDVSQDGHQWRALVNMAWDFGFHKTLGGSRVVAQPVSSWVFLSSVELAWPQASSACSLLLIGYLFHPSSLEMAAVCLPETYGNC